ncbi:MAG: AMIN domain-containing protein [Desulfobacterales bacterium]
MKCPICGSENVTRSHRKGMERISRFISLRTPYRCRECWSRFWEFENPFGNTVAKIAGGGILCLLILGLAWYFLPRGEETSWQAVQRNVGAVPESGPQESERETSSSDAAPHPQTDQVRNQAKTEGNGKKSAEIPTPSIAVPEAGKAETGDAAPLGAPSADSGVISISPKPASESREKEEVPPLSEKSEKGEELPESGTAETASSQLPEKKEESEQISVSVLPESAKTETAASDAETAGEKPVPEVPGESLLTGEKEPAQAVKAAETVPPAPDPESGSAETAVSEPVSFRELKTVKTESEKDFFRIEIVTDGPVRDYAFFHLKSPPKLVVDLPGKWKHRGDALFKVRDSRVSRVRVGQHPDFIRVVLDLKIKSAVKPACSSTDQGLTVTLSRKAE